MGAPRRSEAYLRAAIITRGSVPSGNTIRLGMILEAHLEFFQEKHGDGEGRFSLVL